jgi:uncharacterized protein
MKHKSAAATFKALDDTGTFEAIVSVFGNVDLVGDRIVKGAFAGSIARWQAAGDPIPVVWSHAWGDLDAHIGYVDPADMRETDAGLYVKAHLDVAEDEHARKVHRLLQRRSLKEFSFAYDVVRQRPAEAGVMELLELDVIEVGPTLKGANPATQLLGVKSRRGGLTAEVARVKLDLLELGAMEVLR